MMTSIDQHWAGTWGLRIALLVAAAITGAGWVLARRARVAPAERR